VCGFAPIVVLRPLRIVTPERVVDCVESKCVLASADGMAIRPRTYDWALVLPVRLVWRPPVESSPARTFTLPRPKRLAPEPTLMDSCESTLMCESANPTAARPHVEESASRWPTTIVYVPIPMFCVE